MRNSLILLIGFLLILVQSNLYRVLDFIPINGLVPSLVLPVILFMGVYEYALVRGASLSFALGYMCDVLGVAPVGLYTFTFVAMYLFARLIGVRFAAQTYVTQWFVSLIFTLIHSSLVIVLIAIFGRGGRDSYVPRTVYVYALPHALSTPVFIFCWCINEGYI